MEMAVLEVDKAEAKERLTAYRQHLKDQRTREDKEIARGYYQVTQGRLVISLTETIRAGGFDEKGLPRLAICVATATRCAVNTGWDHVLYMDDHARSNPWAYSAGVGDQHVRVPWHRDDRPEWVRVLHQRSGTAIVPVVPPEHRAGRKMHRFHILWEAEWSEVSPRDPALLKHVGGDLWAVYATWDLTELERAVLRQTRAAR
jgi:hypothetical protein